MIRVNSLRNSNRIAKLISILPTSMLRVFLYNIISGHYFDLSGSISIGKHSWIAGYGSQFWTHGTSTPDTKVVKCCKK